MMTTLRYRILNFQHLFVVSLWNLWQGCTNTIFQEQAAKEAAADASRAAAYEAKKNSCNGEMLEEAEQLAAAVAAAVSKSKKVHVNFLSVCSNCFLYILKNNGFKVRFSFSRRICPIKAF